MCLLRLQLTRNMDKRPAYGFISGVIPEMSDKQVNILL